MKKKLTLVIAAYVVLIAGLLCYAQSPRVILKNTVMPYEKDFTMPKSVKKIIFERKKINIKYNNINLIIKEEKRYKVIRLKRTFKIKNMKDDN